LKIIRWPASAAPDSKRNVKLRWTFCTVLTLNNQVHEIIQWRCPNWGIPEDTKVMMRRCDSLLAEVKKLKQHNSSLEAEIAACRRKQLLAPVLSPLKPLQKIHGEFFVWRVGDFFVGIE